MRNRVFKAAAIALTLSLATAGGIALAMPVTNATALPETRVPAPPHASAQVVTTPESAPVPTIDESLPPLEQEAAAAPVAKPSKALPVTALVIGTLALLGGIGLAIAGFITERNHNGTFDSYDKAFNANAKKIADLERAVSELRADRDTTRRILSTLHQQLEARGASMARPDFTRQMDDRAPPPPPQPAGASPEDVAELLSAYRDILLARDPGPLQRFIETYQPQDVIVSDETLTVSHQGDGTIWMITRPHWGGEGIVLPGDYAIRSWGTAFQPSGGLRAEKVFGTLYRVQTGNMLEIESPCRVRISDHGPIRLTQKGILLGA